MPVNLPSLIDNSRLSLNDVIHQLAPDSKKKISIATGYWDLEGTLLIFNNVKGYKEIWNLQSVQINNSLLIGIAVAFD